MEDSESVSIISDVSGRRSSTASPLHGKISLLEPEDFVESEEIITLVPVKVLDNILDFYPMSDEEFETMQLDEARSKVTALLIQFIILIFTVPFSAMYFCYYHVFNGEFNRLETSQKL